MRERVRLDDKFNPKPRRNRVRLYEPDTPAKLAAPPIVNDKAADKLAQGLTPETLAYALPGGLAKLAYPKFIYNPFIQDVENKILRIAEGKQINIMFSAPPRHGKALAHDTPILTTEGWTTHGELKVGDNVYGPDGRPTTIQHLAAEVDECVPVKLTNGETIWCHPNHEWTVYDKKRDKKYTAETRKLKKRVKHNGKLRLKLPKSKPIKYAPANLEMHPYAMGCWMGNPIETVSANPVVTDLILARAFGKEDAERIPEQYLRSSKGQRLSFLAGLLDSCGKASPEGDPQLVMRSEDLKAGVEDLLATLAINWVEKRIQDEVIIEFECPYELPSKLFFNYVKVKKRRPVYIKKIGKSRKRRARSIMVDRSDGLYLAGRRLAPTHNTMFISRVLPAWYLGRNPDHRVLLVTYQDGFSRTQSRHARNIFKRLGPKVFDLRVAEDTQAANAWDIADHEGGMEAVGAGGAITGKGAHLLIVDDIVKGREQAMNENVLNDRWEWFLTDVLSRLEPGASVVVLMTRWSRSDVIGQVLAKKEEEAADPGDPDEMGFSDWEFHNYPALAVKGDILGRKVGEALFPKRYDETFLKKIKARWNDEYWWEALYQGNPVPMTGDIIDVTGFKREYEGKNPPPRESFDMVIISADTAIKDTEVADYTVFGVWGVRHDGYYLLDVIRDKMKYPQLVETSQALNRLWFPEFFLIEDKGSGSSLIQELRQDYTVNVWPIEPGNESKVIRMLAETTTIKAGMVILPDNASWKEDFLLECRSFPRGKKDQVDMLSQALKFLRQNSSGIRMW